MDSHWDIECAASQHYWKIYYAASLSGLPSQLIGVITTGQCSRAVNRICGRHVPICSAAMKGERRTYAVPALRASVEQTANGLRWTSVDKKQLITLDFGLR